MSCVTSNARRAAVSFLLLLAVACSNSNGSDAPDPVEAPILSAAVSADQRTVTLTVGGDPCSTVSRTDVDEGADSVVVAVFLAGPESAGPECAGMTATQYEVPIRLDAPLGTRRVTTSGGGPVTTRRS